MSKLLLAMLCIGSNFLAFADDSAINTNASIAFDEVPRNSISYRYIGYGIGNVLDGNYETASEYIDAAEFFLSDLNEGRSLAEVVIAATRAVICNNLGLDRQCEQAVGILFLSLAANEGDEMLDFFLDHNNALKFSIRAMASTTPSAALQELLFFVFDDDEDCLLPDYSGNLHLNVED